jgi:hypothetical protein
LLRCCSTGMTAVPRLLGGLISVCLSFAESSEWLARCRAVCSFGPMRSSQQFVCRKPHFNAIVWLLSRS